MKLHTAKLYCGCEIYVEAVEKSKTGNNWSTFDVLIIMYGYLGKLKELDQIWSIVQGFSHVRSTFFLLAIEAFGRIRELNLAKELWEEVKLQKGLKATEQYNSIISVYCKNPRSATGFIHQIFWLEVVVHITANFFNHINKTCS